MIGRNFILLRQANWVNKTSGISADCSSLGKYDHLVYVAEDKAISPSTAPPVHTSPLTLKQRVYSGKVQKGVGGR